MNLYKNKQKSEILPSRLTFQKPTDPQEPEKGTTKPPEKTKEGPTKRRGFFETVQELLLRTKPKPQEHEPQMRKRALEINNLFHTNAKLYVSKLSTTKNELEIKRFELESTQIEKEIEELVKNPSTNPEELKAKQALSRQYKARIPEITKLRTAYEALEKRGSELRKLAESDAVSRSELQGGGKWLGTVPILDENGNIIDANLAKQADRYGILSVAYLKLRTNSNGQDILVVRDELNNTSKVKYSLGAGHLLPPSIRTVEITDTSGNFRSGVRKTINGRVGYYEITADNRYSYIPIFGGYTIRPITGLKDADGKEVPAFLNESSDEYRKEVEAEALVYASRAQSIFRAEHETPEAQAYLRSIGARSDYPIANLKTLQNATTDEINAALNYMSPKQREEEIKRIQGAKQDLTRTEAMLDHFDIPISSDSDANAGIYLISIQDQGGAAKMLGWEDKHTELQDKWRENLLDPKFIESNSVPRQSKELTEEKELTLTYGSTTQRVLVEKKNKEYVLTDASTGKKIEDIGTWTIRKAASLTAIEPNSTVKLIQAMNHGGSINIGGTEYRFSGAERYELNISNIKALHDIVNDSGKFKKVCEKLDKPIKPSEFIAGLFEQGTMSLNEAKEYVERMGLRYLFTGNTTLDNLMRQTTTATTINPQTVDWNKYRNKCLLGDKQCANYVTSVLGLGRGGSGLVNKLVSKLIRGGHRLVFGFENYQAGDVIAWTSVSERLGFRTYSHTGIVRNTFTYNGQKYLAIQQEGKTIQLNIVPVSHNGDVATLRHNLRNRNRQTFFEQLKSSGNSRAVTVLEDIYAYRSGSNESSVHIIHNQGWHGDYSKNKGGNIAFAVRTNIAPPV